MPTRDPLGAVGCVAPFRKIEILSDGRITMCCYTWLPHFCGNLLTDSAEEIMSNAVRVGVQGGMRKGEFHLCTSHCPYLAGYRHTDDPLDTLWPLVPVDTIDEKIAGQPYGVFLTYDDSCNLQCPSCRKGLIWHKQSDPASERMSRIHDKAKELINLLLASGNRVQLHITGSGDPFASWLFWGYLQELAAGPINPNLTISLATNGVMMTRENMELIRPLWPSIDNVSVSIDAATEDTYRIVRRGGNFEKLGENLASFDRMVLDGLMPNLGHWQSNFIVQRDNFRELRMFVEWQLGYQSLDMVWTNLIAQWGHMDDGTYADMAVWREGHPMREELREMLRDPIFRNPRVFLGNMSQIVPVD